MISCSPSKSPQSHVLQAEPPRLGVPKRAREPNVVSCGILSNTEELTSLKRKKIRPLLQVGDGAAPLSHSSIVMIDPFFQENLLNINREHPRKEEESQEIERNESAVTTLPSDSPFLVTENFLLAGCEIVELEIDLRKKSLPLIDALSKQRLQFSIENLLEDKVKQKTREELNKEMRVVCYPNCLDELQMQYLLTGQKIYRVAKNKLLGSGGYGAVYALEKISGKSVKNAIKLLKSTKDVNKAQEMTASIENECRLLQEIHQDQASLLGIMAAPQLVKKYISPGVEEVIGYIAPKYDAENYERYLAKRVSILTLPEKIFQMAQLLRALKNLREKKVIHGDIKGANILIDKKNLKRVKLFLSDFGGAILEKDIEVTLSFTHTQSRVLSSDQKALCAIALNGQLDKALQLQEYIRIKEAMDCFALGVLLFTLFRKPEAEILPYPQIEKGRFQKAEGINSPADYLLNKLEGPPKIKQLIIQMLEPDYQKRLSCDDAFKQLVNLLPNYPEAFAMLCEEGWKEQFLLA